MKKLGALFVLLISLYSQVKAEERTKFLQYKYNDRVVITISSAECPFWELKEAYEFGALAKRIDGDMLIGCYTHHNDDIVIRWLHGDESIFPANVFILNPSL